MRLVFAHDHYFHRAIDGAILSRGKFPYAVWQRYLDVFSTVHVLGRRSPANVDGDAGNLNRSSGANVTFTLVPSISGPIKALCNRTQAAHMVRSEVEKADAVVARLPSELGLLALDAAKEYDRPALVELVGCAWDALWHHGSILGRVYAPASWWRTRRAVWSAQFVIYVTSEFLQSRYPTRGASFVCSNVEVHIENGDILARRTSRIHAQQRPFVIATIAPYSLKYKGLHVALRALARASRFLPDYKYRILGAGDPSSIVRKADRLGLSDRIELCGPLPTGPAVRAFLDDVDLYLQPSLTEGLPRALIEAMSRGCPALASSAGGMTELLDPSCLHPPGDYRLLGDQLCSAASDLGWQLSQAERNYHLAGHYSADVLQARRVVALNHLKAAAAGKWRSASPAATSNTASRASGRARA